MMLAAALLLVASAGSAGDASGVFSPCECRHLPALFEELLEQQKLRDLCQEYIDNGTPDDEEFLSIGEVSSRLQWRLDQFIAGRRARSSSGGRGGGGGAAPALGTDFGDEACSLLKYVPNPESGALEPVPTTPEEVRASDCSERTEFLLVHEGVHQKRCHERFAKGGDGSALLNPGNYLREDREAYDQGVRQLRRDIASLARNCGWKGSNRRFKKDRSMVVPTEEQIQQLKDATRKKARALRRGAKP